MYSLSTKSAQEITDLLDEYRIKHGPVVDSTRSLYEKKLKDAMAKGVKPSSDKTYYREEEDEVTYVYKTPVRSEGSGDSRSYMRSRPEWTERQFEHDSPYSSYTRSQPQYRGEACVEPHMYDTPGTYRNTYSSSTPMKSAQEAAKAPEPTRLIPLWVQFVFFLAVAVFLYIVFSSMESNESFKEIQ